MKCTRKSIAGLDFEFRQEDENPLIVKVWVENYEFTLKRTIKGWVIMEELPFWLLDLEEELSQVAENITETGSEINEPEVRYLQCCIQTSIKMNILRLEAV